MKSSSINYAAVAVIIIVLSAAVLVGIALAVYFTWPAANDQATGIVQVRLTGNFTILKREVPDVSDASICVYLTGILTSANIATSNCTIIDKSPWSVKVRYSLEFSTNLNADVALKTASTAIAKSSSDASIFHIDQNSITFEDSKGNVQKYCTNQTQILCHNNSVCISVVGGYECVCNVGYSQSSGGCTKDKESRFCKSLTTWIPTTKVCDKFQDCPDGSDEVNCNEDGRFCKSLNTWIPTTKVCDKFEDCPDDSDEVNCACDTRFQYGCLNGRCIDAEWLCNGVDDCPEGDDERAPQCSQCNASEFQCSNPRNCISTNKQCDVLIDCKDSSDESHCIILGESSANDSNIRLLNATYRGISGYLVCSDGWIDSWSDSVCKQIGYGNAIATSSQVVKDGTFLSFDPTQPSSSNFAVSSNISNCSSLKAVGIHCGSLECGKRNVSLDSVGPYILNGQRAARGAWPWQVIVYNKGQDNGAGQFDKQFICGGSLLNDRWVLTAAHCAFIDCLSLGFGYTGQKRPENMLIRLGTISLLNNSDAIERRVDLVRVHPDYDPKYVDNDVALLRLSQPVSMGETIQPICLPDPNQDLDLFRVCVDTGFGVTLRNTLSNDLLQAKMNIIPGSYCGEYTPDWREETQLCIGVLSDLLDINICHGDSGGPLSCQDQNGAWLLIGVNSYVWGSNDVNAPASARCRLSVVARVTAFLDWIVPTMATLKT